MRGWGRSLLGAILVAWAGAAVSVDAPRVERITPAGQDVPAGRQIVIEFNRPMVPLGRMERRPEELAVSVSPALSCQWRWLNTRALACQLDADGALRPATRYEVRVGADFAAADGAVLGREVVHRFVTARPQLEHAYFRTWQGPGSPVLRLQFNLPVTRESVLRSLRFVPGHGEPVAPLLGEITSGRQEGPDLLPLPGEQTFIIAKPIDAPEQAGAARRYWEAMPATPLPGASRVTLRITPGLATPQGPLPGAENRVVLGFDTFPAFRFLGVQCLDNRQKTLQLAPGEAAGACNPMHPVALKFSAPVLAEEIADKVRFEPDLAGGREDYDPWENQGGYSQLWGPYQKGRVYHVYLPEHLQARQAYEIEAAGALHDEFGRPLQGELAIAFETDARPPNLVLPYRQAVVESQVDNDVPLAVTNLDHVDVHYSGVNSAGAIPEQTARLDIPAVPDVAFYHPLGLRERLGASSGAISGYFTPSPSVPGMATESFRFFAQATPYQVHVKLGHFDTLVWVTDLASGAPVADARVAVQLSAYFALGKAGAPEAEAVTDSDGLAVLPGRSSLDPGLDYRYRWDWEQPRLFVRVQKGDALALLPLDHDFEVSAASVTGWSIYGDIRPRDGHITAWGTTAQGVYRAGDEIQYKLYVRDQDGRSFVAPSPGPYQLRIIDPTGKLAHEKDALELDSFGALAGSYTVPETAPVGWYRFELTASNLPQPLQPLQVLVADFTPSPFRVGATLNGELFRADDEVLVETTASMHAGGPYADTAARVTARLYPQALTPSSPTLRGFYFQTLNDQRGPETVFQTEAEVDRRGSLESRFRVGSERVLYGRLDVESAVSDDRGKYVAGFAAARYAGRDRYIGLRMQGWLLEAGKPAQVEAAVIDAEGEPVEALADVLVEREELTAARVKGAGNAFITRYNRKWVTVHRCESLQAGADPARCEFTPDAPGRYRLTGRVSDAKGREHRTELHRWGIGEGRVLWAEQPGRSLEMVPEQDSYQVGDTARFLLKNPFPGAYALVTVERYGVIERRVQRLEGSTPVIELPVTADFIPGVYVSVVVVSPRVEAPPGDNGADLGRPTLRMGYVKLDVRDPYKEVVVSAEPERERYKPGETVRIDLHAAPRHGAEDRPVQLAVAVLDEAVFDLVEGGEAYFDPYAGFYSLSSLDVDNFSLLARLIGLQKFEKKGANAGGDGGGDIDARRIERYVSYWNPSIETDAEGRARIDFPAPDNLTGWRVLVLAATPEDRFGLGQASFQVNQPIELRPVMPNQVLQGDRFQAGFSVMNRSDRERQLTLRWRVESNGETRELEDTVALDAYERRSVFLDTVAEQPGSLRFTLRAGDGEASDALVHELAVRSHHRPITAAEYGMGNAEPVTVSVQVPGNAVPGVGTLGATLAPTLLGNLDGAFAYLREYPYGGWEQQLARGVMAARYLTLREYLPETLAWPEAEALPAEVLQQAAGFQAPSGGMSHFRAEDAYVSPYLSAYTALAFNWLRTAGHEPPSAVERNLHDYLENLLRRDVVPDYYSAGMAATVRAVALAALAEHDRLTPADLERYRAHMPRMSLFGKAHYLRAALQVDGTEEIRHEVADAILAHAVESGGKLGFNESLDDGYVRILATPLRTQCAILSALTAQAALDGSLEANGMPAKLVRSIVQSRGKRDHWENTQENVFCVNALAEYAAVFEAAAPASPIVVDVGEETLGEARFTSRQEPAVTLERPLLAEDVGAQHELRLTPHSAGPWYYAARVSYAPSETAQEEVNAGISLKREYSVRRNGHWQLLESPVQLRRGELVRVDLYLSLPTARHFVVVEDPVGGGLEPVNRQLATASAVDADAGAFDAAGGSWYLQYSDWIGYNVSRWSFHHQELRHDAARFYADYLPPGNYHLSYSAQAVAVGEFALPAAHTEELYDPDVFGDSAPSRLEVGD